MTAVPLYYAVNAFVILCLPELCAAHVTRSFSCYPGGIFAIYAACGIASVRAHCRWVDMVALLILATTIASVSTGTIVSRPLYARVICP